MSVIVSILPSAWVLRPKSWSRLNSRISHIAPTIIENPKARMDRIHTWVRGAPPAVINITIPNPTADSADPLTT